MAINTTRRSFVGATASLSAAAFLAACSSAEETPEEVSVEEETTGETEEVESGEAAITGSYTAHVQGYDWGPGVDKVTITLDEAIESVTADDLEITEYKQMTDWTAEDFPVVEGDVPRTIKDVTLSADGKTIDVELACAPNDGDGPLLFTMATQYNTWSDPYALHILKAPGSSIPDLDISTDFDIATADNSAMDAGWQLDSYDTADGVTLRYAYFAPEEETDKLVVWLHGMGEGGTVLTDPWISVLGNKVVALSESAFQETVGAAHVVAPQSPTFWMDSDGKGSNFNGGGIQADTNSFYTPALEEFIDAYAEKVGATKICVCGCSNGGYMTMVLSMSRPDAYSCVVPICEAVPDETISDEQIASLKDLPMYFIYSEDDTTVDPTLHEIPTIERLKAAGKTSETLQVATSEHVVDTSGEFTDENGDPYTYAGHWSWIYFDNNDIESADGLKPFDFIAENLK